MANTTLTKEEIMSTAFSQMINDGSVAANRTASGIVGIDRRRRRFGLNPGAFRWTLSPRESGQQAPILRVGLLTFRTTPLKVENFDDVMKVQEGEFQKEIMRDHEAAWFAENVKINYEHQGFRELPSLTLLDDPQPNEKGNVTKEQFAKSAQGYFAAIHPAFVEINHVCPMELSECVTCRLELLGDEAMSELIAERTARLSDQDCVERLWLEVKESVQAAQDACSTRWAELVGEMGDRKGGNPGIAKLGEAEHHVRRNLHAIEPSEAATAASYGMEVGERQAEGFKEMAAAIREGKDNGLVDVLKGLVETQKQQGQILAELSKKKSE